MIRDADGRDRATTAHAFDSGGDRRQIAYRLDASVYAESACSGFDRIHRRRLPGIDGDCAQALRQLEAAIHHVNREDAGRPEKLGRHDRHQPHGSGPDHSNCVAGLDLRALRGKEPRRQDVTDEDGLFVPKVVRDRLQRVVGKRHDDVLRLPAA